MSLSLVLAVVAGVLAGAVAALKVIAPLTKTDKDDKVLAYAEKAEEVVGGLAPHKP